MTVRGIEFEVLNLIELFQHKVNYRISVMRLLRQQKNIGQLAATNC
jgi:hypothetical protein